MEAGPTPHPTDQTLQAYGLGQLDEASAGPVHSHLEGCIDCRRRVAELSSDSFLGRLRDARSGPSSQGPAVSATAGLSMPDAGAAVAASPPAATLPPGLADHPDYEVLRELGRGGMGVVYLARNTLMGRMEVLKVVGGHLVSRPAILDRFLREIRSAARLHHPNIVTAYAAMRLGESLVLTMEYVEGLDLARLVKAKGPLPVANACHYVHQAATGLQHAHEHGMVHRDIKPANLILARASGRANKAIVKVLDFGLAKVTSEGQADSGLTREGQMLGTPDYIAPEQIRDAQSADIRADIYSLGCTLYYLLSGGPPFRGDNLWDVYQAHFSMDAAPLNLVRPGVPVELAALVAKMMAKEPERRFREPKEVAQALTPFFKAAAAQPSGSDAEISRTHSAPAPTTTAGSNPQPPTAGGSTSDPTGRRPTGPRADGVPWEALIDIKPDEPMTEAKPSGPAEATAASAGDPARRPPWLRPAILAASVFGALAMGAIFYVATDKGRIKIVVDGPEPVVTIDGETVRIEGLDAPITLRAGEHVLTVKQGDTEVETRKFLVRRGDNEALRVEYEPMTGDRAASNRSAPSSPETASRETAPPTAAQSSGSDRRAAEMALSRDGSVTIRVNGRSRAIEPGQALPTSEFRLTHVRLIDRKRLTDAALEPFAGLMNLLEMHLDRNPKITDAGIAKLRNLPQLEVLRLDYSGVTDAALPGMKDFPALHVLTLRSTGVTDAGLAHLKGLTRLRTLILGETGVTDAGLVHLAEMKELKTLMLNHTRVTDAGLVQLQSLKRLTQLDLTETGVTAAGIGGLKKSLPACEVIATVTPRANPSGTPARTTTTKAKKSRKEPSSRLEVSSDPPASNRFAETNPWPVALPPAGQRFPQTSRFLGMSRDGRRIAVMSPNGDVRIVEAPDVARAVEITGLPRTAEGKAQYVWSAEFSPDGKSLAVACNNDNRVRFWDASTGEEVRESDGGAVGLAYSSDGKRLAGAGRHRKIVRVWDAMTGADLRTLGPHSSVTICVAFSPDGRRLASGSGPQPGGKWDEKFGLGVDLKIWDTETGVGSDLAGHPLRVNGVAFSPDGQRLASASTDKTVKVWDMATRECLVTFDKHQVPVSAARFSPDGRLIASIGAENAVRVWDSATGREVAILTGLGGHPQFLHFSPGGRWIYAGSRNLLKAWEAPSAPTPGPPGPTGRR